MSPKDGQSFTSRFGNAVDHRRFLGDRYAGFRRCVNTSWIPPGIILTMEISTIRSVATLVPVVSRSKIASGRVRVSSIKGGLKFEFWIWISQVPVPIPILKYFFHLFQEHSAECTVYDTVVISEREDHDMPYTDQVSCGVSMTTGFFLIAPMPRIATWGWADWFGVRLCCRKCQSW